MWIIQSFFMSSMVFCDFLGMFEAIFPIPFHRTFKHSNRGFPVPQSSPRRVAGFFCNGEIGAPGLTKPSDDLAQREQVRERRWMDGWVFFFFFGDEKMVKQKSWGKCLLEERELHLIFLLHTVYIYIYVFICKYIRGGGFEFNQDVGWFYTCKSGWVAVLGGYHLGEKRLGPTRWGPCLYTASPLSSRFLVMEVCVSWKDVQRTLPVKV